MASPVITVSNLSKQYRIGKHRARYTTFREALAETAASPWRRFRRAAEARPQAEDHIWALRDVSFAVGQGEVVGIIGRNGAGKSTLLKILAEITCPTEGCVEILGRVGSLLEVGTGFHPELTGRENIYLNGAILGMTRTEINRKFDEIVAFAETERFLDTPVKRYSSGMQVRLAFAVAAHLEPDILIVDEVLAVGDAAFQKKCAGKMESVAQGEGRTILLVSHNMAAVEALCTRALLLEQGRVQAAGETAQVIEEYVAQGAGPSTDTDLTNHPGRPPGLTPVARRLRVTDETGGPLTTLPLGGTACFDLELGPLREHRTLEIGLNFYSAFGQRATTLNSLYQCPEPIRAEGPTRVSCVLRNCRLMPGLYTLNVLVMGGRERIDQVDSALTLEVTPRDVYGTGKLLPPKCGTYAAEAEWRVTPLPE